ncbi:MAG: hypothetical protein Q7S61_06510 [bacterium]|nr:hypothetical protein [bacterium]
MRKKPDSEYLTNLCRTLIQQLRISGHVTGLEIHVARLVYSELGEKIRTKLGDMKPSTRGRIASLAHTRESARKVNQTALADITSEPLDLEKGGELVTEIACRVIAGEIASLIVTCRLMSMAGRASATASMFIDG